MNDDQPLRILYVEDNHDSFEMLKVMLAISHIEVARASSIDDALTMAGAERFDLYLLDGRLPDGDGLSLCRILREIDHERPLLFYSGNASSEEVEMAMSAGADGYITKPHSDKLTERIIQLVANRPERPDASASLLSRAA